MKRALVWTRHRPGFYTCGNFTIENAPTKHGARWTLKNDLVPAWSTTRATLHECQSAAASVASESTLLAFARATRYELEQLDPDSRETPEQLAGVDGQGAPNAPGSCPRPRPLIGALR